MCLSTPTTTENTSAGNTSASATCSSSSQCPNATHVACNSNNNNNSNLIPKTTKLACNENVKIQQKNLDDSSTKNLSSITTLRRKTTQIGQATEANNNHSDSAYEDYNSKTKDLPCDRGSSTSSSSLGYNEENAVYREIPKTKDQQEAVASSMQAQDFKPEIRWPDLVAQLYLHLGAVYGFYLLFSAKSQTFMWLVLAVWVSGIGITAGAHRLWSHKSYNASLPLRIVLIFLFTIAGQRDAYTWALDHRIHHKFSETEADPHNAKRGFWFAHVGWLFLTPHPKVAEKRKVIDMSDLENDGVVMFQRRWFIPMFALISIGLPVLVPWHFWGESLWKSFWICFNLRFTTTLNAAFFVNSVAHMWGSRPYDKNISPVESRLVSFMALGEGWHNYHHVFPWDYKTGEFGSYRLNITTAFIDFCAKLGLATGLKSVSPDMIKRRAMKCGDGSRFLSDEYAHKDAVWGYGDRDIPKDDLQELKRM
uniref:Putative fatty acid desaturase n=2 Tax=Haematobia irritans TaxID=7368 RepID=A0A1L8EJ74_HAEIR